MPLVAWALAMDLGGIRKTLLICPLLLVLVVELVNSAIESTVDRIGTERHPLSGQAKDMSSAAVLVSLVLAAVAWIFILSR